MAQAPEKNPPSQAAQKDGRGCNVSMKLNFTIGALAMAAAALAGYLAWHWIH